MKLHRSLTSILLGMICAVAVCPKTVPAFTGLWKLNLQWSKIEAKNASIGSTVTIGFRTN